ncbi:MAG: pyruvate synthase subunit PorA [Candidatus Thermoplasmatota archaeon]|nr:pyruvate synthase subunit PorA [Candidatus Thermoplasmatota archaeon]
MSRKIVKGAEAMAIAGKLAKPDVVPAFPITPSTTFPEKMSEYVACGELPNTEFVPVESEHSAMSAAIAASATGARTCTATSSQGLALMHEMLFIAAGMRLPIVLFDANRALSAPLNIWGDQQDSISERDAGWIHFYGENAQEGLDLMLMAFRVAEDKRVLLPTMVGIDGFVLTHTSEPVDVPEQKAVDDFLPQYKAEHCYLDPERPTTVGAFAPPEYYMETRYQLDEAVHSSGPVIDEVFADFEKRFGRKYSKIEYYGDRDAEVVFVAIGSLCGTLKDWIDEHRAKGQKVGLVRIIVYRPFPFKELKAALANAKIVAVVDRSISLGYGGPVFSELAAAFVNDAKRPLFKSFIIGLGGRDIKLNDFENIYNAASADLKAGKVNEKMHWVNINKEML